MKQKNPILRTAVSVAVGLVVVFLISMLGGIGVTSGWLSEGMIPTVGLAAAAGGSIFAATITGFTVKEQKLLWTLIGGAVIFLVLLMIHSLAFHEQAYVLTGSAAAILIPSLALGIFFTQRRPKRKYR